MDFDAAIIAHTRWKFRLDDYVEGKGKESLDAATVARDDCCELGKWIHGGGAVHAPELKTEHAAFHEQAAAIVRAAQAGNKAEALKMLSVQGEYMKRSCKVIALIKRMKEGA